MYIEEIQTHCIVSKAIGLSWRCNCTESENNKNRSCVSTIYVARLYYSISEVVMAYFSTIHEPYLFSN